MPNLHPPFSAFPFALLSVVILLEILLLFIHRAEIKPVITVNLGLAAVMVAAAFYSGYQASEFAEGTFAVPDEAIASHHNLGRLLLFLIIPCFAVQLIREKAKHHRKIFSITYYALLIACEVLVVVTGYFGGKLVFGHGAGVTAPVTELLSGPAAKETPRVRSD